MGTDSDNRPVKIHTCLKKPSDICNLNFSESSTDIVFFYTVKIPERLHMFTGSVCPLCSWNVGFTRQFT